MRKHEILGPNSRDAYERKDFSEPRLHLRIHRKSAKFLNLTYLVSLINCDLLMFRLPALGRKAPVCTSSSLASLEQFLRAIWSMSPGLQSSFCPQIKRKSQLSPCANCFQHQHEHLCPNPSLPEVGGRKFFLLPYHLNWDLCLFQHKRLFGACFYRREKKKGLTWALRSPAQLAWTLSCLVRIC